MPDATPEKPLSEAKTPAPANDQKPAGDKPTAVIENKPAAVAAPVEMTPEQKAEELKAAEQRLAAQKETERKAAEQKVLDRKFLEAAKKGNLTELKDLLAKGASLNAADDGNTALFYAAQYGRRDTVLFLLEAGLPVNVKNRIGSTPLTGAAGNGHKEVAQLLYDLGGDPAEKNLTGMSPFHYAHSAGYTDIIGMLKLPRSNPVEVSFFRQSGDRTLQEIFNFTHEDRVTLIRKGEQGPVEAMQRDSFADIKNESDLRRAFETYKKRGGTITESAIFGDRKREAEAAAPPPAEKKKSWLPWKK